MKFIAPQLTSRVIPGSCDPVNMMKVIQKEVSEGFLFEASKEIGSCADLTILGVGPFSKIRDKKGLAEMTEKGETKQLTQSFLETVDLVIRALPSTKNLPTRFHGGMVFGFLGYDFIPYIEKRLKKVGYFPQALEENSNGEVSIVEKIILVDHVHHVIHLVAPEQRDLDELEKLVRKAAKIETPQLAEFSPSRFASSRLASCLGTRAFRDGVQKIKKHISRGDIFQAVLAEKFEIKVKAPGIEIFRALRKRSNAPFHFFYHGEDREFFGSSPEGLISITDGRVRSFPIAGTKPRGANESKDRQLARSLLRSRKEAAEHLMLVDLARNDLGRIAKPGSVRVKSFRNLNFLPDLMHLVSEVEAELLDSITTMEALSACFPAGTLSGAPKIRAMEILSEIEKTPRGYYGGAILACTGDGLLESCIAIRCAEKRGETVILRAGAGIVADSKAEKEYAEIGHKIQGLLKAISQAEAHQRIKSALEAVL